MFRGEVSCLFVVSTLATHGDGRLQVEFELTGSLNERVQLACIFQLRVAVQEERGVINRRTAMIVQLFQVLNQVVDSLGIEILRLI